MLRGGVGQPDSDGTDLHQTEPSSLKTWRCLSHRARGGGPVGEAEGGDEPVGCSDSISVQRRGEMRETGAAFKVR